MTVAVVVWLCVSVCLAACVCLCLCVCVCVCVCVQSLSYQSYLHAPMTNWAAHAGQVHPAMPGDKVRAEGGRHGGS